MNFGDEREIFHLLFEFKIFVVDENLDHAALVHDFDVAVIDRFDVTTVWCFNFREFFRRSLNIETKNTEYEDDRESHGLLRKRGKMLPKTRLIPVFTGVLMIIAGFVPLKRVDAHGEEKPGPNGGEIRMPGAFHTELKQVGREFHVYLLDLEFKNPMIENSGVEISALRAGALGSPWLLVCRATKAARPAGFVCSESKYAPQASDILKVRAKRGASAGNETEYKLPLLGAPEKANKTGAKPVSVSHDHAHAPENHEARSEKVGPRVRDF